MPLKRFSAFLFPFLLLSAASFAQTAASHCDGHAELNGWERAQFLEVSYGQRMEISAQYLAAPGCGAQMLTTLTGLGAKIVCVRPNAWMMSLRPRKQE